MNFASGFKQISVAMGFMSLSTVIRFQPIYQTRVWGGRTLESRFGRQLPDAEQPFGESWEISARQEADSPVISEGEFHGKTLTELWSDPQSREAVFGPSAAEGERFPLLCKILDARDKLSIQVHPPQQVADQLGGEPKTEVWYIADADEGAELYVGVKQGVTEESFRSALENGTVDKEVHVLYPKKGDYIFIESGRLHAIGAGLLIYEIQQNSDTTYRVFDWNRVGLDGTPRDLHVEESMMCIDFTDVEPVLDSSDSEVICECDYFRLEEHELSENESIADKVNGRFAIVTVVEGYLSLNSKETAKEGEFFIIPFGSDCIEVKAAQSKGKILLTCWP